MTFENLGLAPELLKALDEAGYQDPTPIQAAAIWLFWSENVNVTIDGQAFYGDGAAPGMTLRLIGLAAFLIVALVQSWGLLGLRRTFQEASIGRVFSQQSVQGFRLFAITSLIVIFANEANWLLFETIKEWAALEGQAGSFTVSTGLPSWSEVSAALLLIFVAQAFAIGKGVQEENDAFV